MSRVLFLGIALAAPACSDRTPAGDPAPVTSTSEPLGPITLREPSGAVAMTVASAGGRCDVTFGGATITYVRDGETLSGPLAVERTPAGDQIQRAGARIARIWRDPGKPGHTDVVDPEGMALVRIDATTTAATLTDAGGAPIAKVALEGGRFVATDPRAAALAYVTGGDAETAALLASSLPPDVRAVAVCDRLLSARVSP